MCTYVLTNNVLTILPVSHSSSHPLVLTLTLDADSFQFFNDLRQQHFPPERNYLAAHLTLFHQLPGNEADRFVEGLEAVSTRYNPLTMLVSEVRLLGKGVGYRIESKVLQQLHRQLQKQWQSYLTAQDQQRIWPHITIQNKVSPDVARALHEQLSSEFEPFNITGTGLHLWEYHGGPWQSVKEFTLARSVSGS